jgi:type I restriction enzyme, S subunit
VSLNKADCIQARPNDSLVNSEYLCALINQPSTEKMAHDLIMGQTRLRISMGRLRGLEIPIPPLSLQQQFAQRIASIEALKATHREALTQLDALFASLQHRAFRGEL